MKNSASKKYKQKGFILVYTAIILAIMVIIAGIITSTILKEISISRDEGESLKAFYAADAGLGCIRYFQNTNQAFNPTTPENTYNCGVGADFTAGELIPTSECEARSYEIHLEGFMNGACTDISIEIVPREISINGNLVMVCDANVISNGRNRCTTDSSSKIVERTRWEKM